jgi:hypothetical protein
VSRTTLIHVVSLLIATPWLMQARSIYPRTTALVGGVGTECDADGNTGSSGCNSPCLESFSIYKSGNSALCDTFDACDEGGCAVLTGGSPYTPDPPCK